jgi:hypothetical protein
MRPASFDDDDRVTYVHPVTCHVNKRVFGHPRSRGCQLDGKHFSFFVDMARGTEEKE